ncbi:SH3 domain-containing protein [Rhodovulum kholense]|uniref:SH3-like domain-containing protein n=1 Tax=Rhodovulum kholense TaxID=453584 RepID=A0A8E2VJ62_9RHOB|nr:SH3 domain-containing protein [Rhodovulum kholense]PTW49558.1 SH3-like domain-containing protein [Rhodovulum kholense]
MRARLRGRAFLAISLLFLIGALSWTGPVLAEERGRVTNLPLPRYVSLKAAEGNVRRGPSLSHRIDWVYTRRGVPLQITAEFGHWRQVRDRDGAGGWVHYSLLSGVRTVIVDQDMLPLLRAPRPEAEVLAKAEAGVIARLGECSIDWCRISADGASGWVPKTAIWGVDADEIRE